MKIICFVEVVLSKIIGIQFLIGLMKVILFLAEKRYLYLLILLSLNLIFFH